MEPKTRRILKWLLIVTLVLGVIALAAYIFFPGLPKSVKVYDVVQLNQQWTPEERQWFYHTSQGSRLMPYQWFISLEQADNEKLFIDPDHLTKFRVIPDVNPRYNPDRLPVGFSRDPASPVDPNGPLPASDYVGITCAGCHTAQINYKGLGLRIDGAPGQLDLTKFLQYVGLAMGATDLDPRKYDRFARRVLGARYSDRNARDQLRQGVRKFIKGQLQTLLEQSAADEETGQASTDAGFGRLDALGQGGNILYGKLNKKNLRALNSPVNVIPLWYANSYGWVQSNASIRQPMARNLIEAMAVNAYLVLPGNPQTRYTSSVRMDWMAEMEDMASRLKAPAWPEWLFGDLDRAKVSRGKVLYQELCASCHQPRLETAATNDGVAVVPGPYPPDPVSEGAGKRFYHLPLSDIETIGTDPYDAVNFADRTADATALGLSANEPGANVIYPVIKGTMDRYYREHKISPDQQVIWNGYRANYWRAPKAYPARPLAGIWATAPFLHNGSVTTLFELLSPVEERSKTFYLGNLEFDPVRVGYEQGRFYGGFKLDTSKTGNSNAGHEFRDDKGKGVIGRWLSEEERWALIEFLKALRFEDEVAPELAPPAGWPQNPGGTSPSEGDSRPGNVAGGQSSPAPAN